MKRKFYIDFNNGYADMLMQYKIMHEQIGAVRFLPNHNESRGIIYDIRPEYGKGTTCLQLIRKYHAAYF